MPKLSPLSRRELVRKLKVLGFEGPYPGGKHQWMRRGRIRIIVPNPHEGDIDPALIRSIRSTLQGANDKQTFWALQDVSFEVKQGEVLGLIGRNGAGKSMLLLKIFSSITLAVDTGWHPEPAGWEDICWKE